LTERSEIWWVEGRSLATGRAAFVPAPFVFIPYTSTSENEWLGPGTSTGMAAGWSWTRACISGLLEVCERDAFMIAWLNRLSRPRLRPVPGSPFAAEIERLLHRQRASVSFVDLSNDLGVPVVLAVLDSRVDGRRIVTMGAAARPSWIDAARKAVLEAVSDLLRLGIVLARPGEPWRAAPDFSNVTDFEFHSLAYVDPAHQPVLELLTASTAELAIDRPSPFGAVDDEALLEALVRRVVARGLDPVVVTLTTRDIADLGVHVVKVVVPGAVPMPPDHRWQWLGHRRTYEVPAALGLLPRPSQPHELLLDYPHPFA
jgi:ribosomal protein S12 methylthiotransferase accessory factor